jgi:hypothetical protein
LAQIHYFEKLDVECSPYFKGVKGRLAKHLEFWIKIEASDFVIDTIRNGDVIPICGIGPMGTAHVRHL